MTVTHENAVGLEEIYQT